MTTGYNAQQKFLSRGLRQEGSIRSSQPDPSRNKHVTYVIEGVSGGPAQKELPVHLKEKKIESDFIS